MADLGRPAEVSGSAAQSIHPVTPTDFRAGQQCHQFSPKASRAFPKEAQTWGAAGGLISPTSSQTEGESDALSRLPEHNQPDNSRTDRPQAEELTCGHKLWSEECRQRHSGRPFCFRGNNHHHQLTTINPPPATTLHHHHHRSHHHPNPHTCMGTHARTIPTRLNGQALPVAGAVSGGAKGFCKGLAGGTAALIALPVAGVASGAVQIGRGAERAGRYPP